MTPPLVIQTCPADRVLLLTLNRPAELNALSEPLLDELASILDKSEDDADVACVIITGAGSAFCGGAEISEIIDHGAASYSDTERLICWGRIDGFIKPVIAAVNGCAFGLGLELALLCDIVLASESAQFAMPEIDVAAMPRDGATQRLPRLVGRSFAMQMVLTGEVVDAQLAERKGLVSEVLPEESLLDRAVAIGTSIASKSMAITPYAKAAIRNADQGPLAQGLLIERELAMEASATEDRIEALRALAEKRAPRFRGR